MNILSVLCDAGIKLGSPEKMSDSLVTYFFQCLRYHEYAVVCGLQTVVWTSTVDFLWFLQLTINVSENLTICLISDS